MIDENIDECGLTLIHTSHGYLWNYGITWMVGADDTLTRLTPTARQRLSAREQRLNASSTYPNTRMPANITVISLAVNQVTCDLELLPSCNIFHNNLQLDTDLVKYVQNYQICQ